ncbi:Folliculin [Tupaia chinensis]|uniref:Folliculin n=1 Tax=Tupaia chinensis TaxID=246437 RepID=L9K3M0_TUPCH|nr:Folliculin [Tupaia chinensis]
MALHSLCPEAPQGAGTGDAWPGQAGLGGGGDIPMNSQICAHSPAQRASVKPKKLDVCKHCQSLASRHSGYTSHDKETASTSSLLALPAGRDRGIFSGLQGRVLRVFKVEQFGCPQWAQRMDMAFTSFLHQRKGKSSSLLTILTSEDDPWAYLRTPLAWFLKACGIWLIRKLLEGVPTEDMLVEMDKLANVEEESEG